MIDTGDITIEAKRVTLEKFDGDVNPNEPGVEPVEKIVIEDGKIVEHWQKGVNCTHGTDERRS